MTTTITFNAKGHHVTVVSVKGSAWGTVAIDVTKTLSFTVDPGGDFERTLYAHLGKLVSGPTKSTTSIANDTVTAVFATNGGDPSLPEAERVNTRFKDAHAGETVEILLAEAGIFGDGTLASDAVAAETAVTNNSTVAKPRPICGWVDEPAPLELIRGSTVAGAVMAGCGYLITQVEVTITDSALATATGFATLEARDRRYPFGPVKSPVWRYSIDCSGLADGACIVSFVATTEAGSTFNSEAFGLPDLIVHLDKDSSEPSNLVPIDSSSQLPVSGTFIATKGDILVGGTSGAEAVVNTTVENGAEIRVVMMTTTAFSASETITGQTSGSITATGAQVANYGADPLPADSICTAIIRGGFGVLGKVQSNYTWPIGPSDSFSNPDANSYRAVIEPDYEGRFHLIRNPIGKPGGNRDHRLFRVLLRDCVLDTLDSNTLIWNIGSTDPNWIMMENCRRRTVSGGGGIQFRDNGGFYMVGWDTANIDGSGSQVGWTWGSGPRGFTRFGVCLDTRIQMTSEGDVFYFDNNSTTGGSGNATILAQCDRVLGSSAGTHGDLVQLVGSCKNIISHIIHKDNGYQGFFCNDAASSEFFDGWWIRGFAEATDDGTSGPGPIALHESGHNLLIDDTLSVRSPLLGDGGLNWIPSDPQCDNVFILNSVFSHVGTGSGSNGLKAPDPAAAMVNCHSINGYGGDYPRGGVRCTESAAPDNYGDLFDGPWTDDGVYPSDATSWAPKAGGPLVSRLVADDIAVPGQYHAGGEVLAVGGPIGAFGLGVFAPTVTTPTKASVGATTATLGGNITSDGGDAITERFVVWSEESVNADPEIGGTGVTKVVASGTATGVFTTGVAGLPPETLIAFKAGASNGEGTAYSDADTFTTAEDPAEPEDPSAPRRVGIGRARRRRRRA